MMLYPPFEKKIKLVFIDIDAAKLPLFPFSNSRSFDDQAKIYARGRTTPGEPCSHDGKSLAVGKCTVHPLGAAVTNSAPGMSMHNYGLAMDFVLKINGRWSWDYSHPAWAKYGEIVKRNGLRWGADWNGNGVKDKNDFDLPHCELKTALTVRELKAIYDKGGLAAGGLKAVWAELDKSEGKA